MKKFYLLILSALTFCFSFGSPINGNVNNGSWRTTSTWDKNRTPRDGDTIIIPAGKTIIVNGWEALNNVHIKVYGTLKFSGVFSALDLNTTSSIAVYNNASIQATLDYLQYIMIGTSTVFMAGQVTGPQVANASTGNGFTYSVALPVKFTDFTVTRKNSDALIQWSTSEEINANAYEVERSIDGSNWSTIAYVTVTGNSSNVNHYAYTDKNVTSKITYYRIKEVDLDGKATFTSIKAITSDITYVVSEIKIASIQNKILIQFPQQVKGNFVVRFVSLNGQVVDQQTISNPVRQIVLNSKVTGNYIISLSNGKDINTAKQVVLSPIF